MNKMIIKQITSSKCQKELKAIYENSFPENERVPFNMLFDKSTFPNFKMYSFYNDENLVGFAYLLIEEQYKIAFLGYIAVKNTLRRQTYGSQILDSLKDIFKDYVIAVNIESTKVKNNNPQERKLRENFYFKNDFKFAGIEFENKGETFRSYYFGKFNQKDYIELMYNYFPELSSFKVENN
jgi:hypothetical protein